MNNGWTQSVFLSFIGCLLISDLPTFLSHHSWVATAIALTSLIGWMLAPMIAERLAIRKRSF